MLVGFHISFGRKYIYIHNLVSLLNGRDGCWWSRQEQEFYLTLRTHRRPSSSSSKLSIIWLIYSSFDGVKWASTSYCLIVCVHLCSNKCIPENTEKGSFRWNRIKSWKRGRGKKSEMLFLPWLIIINISTQKSTIFFLLFWITVKLIFVIKGCTHHMTRYIIFKERQRNGFGITNKMLITCLELESGGKS